MNIQATSFIAPDPVSLAHEMVNGPRPKGAKALLLFEDLARERMHEAERVAHERRLARRLSVVKRWNRVARWATRHADRADQLL